MRTRNRSKHAHLSRLPRRRRADDYLPTWAHLQEATPFAADAGYAPHLRPATRCPVEPVRCKSLPEVQFLDMA